MTFFHKNNFLYHDGMNFCLETLKKWLILLLCEKRSPPNEKLESPLYLTLLYSSPSGYQGLFVTSATWISCLVSGIISCNTAVNSAFISDNNGVFSSNIYESISKLKILYQGHTLRCCFSHFYTWIQVIIYFWSLPVFHHKSVKRQL